MARSPLSEAEVEEVWRRWRSGQAVKVLAREMRRHPSTVRDLLKRCGGVRPAPRRRGGLRLSLAEREEISRGLAAGESLRSIAAGLGRAASTVSREVAGNGGRDRYRVLVAERAAWARAVRPKPTKLSQQPELAALVADRLARRWSPQQIAGWLRRNPQSTLGYVSHETIYRSLFVQARGDLRHELTRYLRTRRAMRRPVGARLPDGRGGRPGVLSISARPAEADDRAVPGHWEGDLVFGRGMTPIATLVERSTRFLMLVALPDGHRADLVAAALAAKITTLPAAVRRTLTWDQGHEMAEHARFTVATGVPVYFCDPKSPWQRGSNENTNGLVRQYLPRTVDMRDYTQADLDAIADELNQRPRQTLGYKTPSEALNDALR
ncbi:IS30 family transposase [Nocardia transvalensis]|uniref:IS30 family transposase n=1 Tax=Nocardia transvalensis TaxID=37333 RepID=UPI00189395D3|nr:IS30 family transposase [Nocardia transvalensis]MBF6332140.1 IS30 family transposase [Nocardia transvalensis]